MKTITFTQNELILLARLLQNIEENHRLTLPEHYDLKKIREMVQKAKASK